MSSTFMLDIPYNIIFDNIIPNISLPRCEPMINKLVKQIIVDINGCLHVTLRSSKRRFANINICNLI